MNAPPTLTVISLGGGVQSSVMALMASGGVPDCVGEDDARWEPPGPCARIERLRFLLYVVNNRRSLCDDLKSVANRPGSRSCAGIPVRLKPPAGQCDGIGGRQCADNRKGRRRGEGRTVVRLNTAALRERLTALNRSQNRLASEIGVGPVACRRRSTRGALLLIASAAGCGRSLGRTTSTTFSDWRMYMNNPNDSSRINGRVHNTGGKKRRGRRLPSQASRRRTSPSPLNASMRPAASAGAASQGPSAPTPSSRSGGARASSPAGEPCTPSSGSLTGCPAAGAFSWARALR